MPASWSVCPAPSPEDIALPAVHALSSETLHATAVAIGDKAVVIEGRSGTGKSDLALRLIDRGATLIADDQVLVIRRGDGLLARCPATIAGQMEVRGLGILPVAYRDDVAVALVVRLGEDDQRMPERRVRRIAGLPVREMVLDPFRASAPIKVELALAHPELPPP